MKQMVTLACAVTAAMFAGAVSAQENADIHPVIGAKPPNELKASDIMALPDTERQAWIHGAVSLGIQATMYSDETAGRCMLDWYFYRGNGKEVVPLALTSYPDIPASAVVIAAMRNVCIKEK